MKTTLGDLNLETTGRTVPVTGQSAAKSGRLQGKATLFAVSSPEWALTVAHTLWDNGDQDVKLHDRGTAPQRFDRLRSTCRLGLTPTGAGEFRVELMQAQMGENDHPRLRKVELADLNADCDVRAVLTGMGAQVGTREQIIGDNSKSKSRYCAQFPRRAAEVAVVAYVLTRIAPFHQQIRVQQPSRARRR